MITAKQQRFVIAQAIIDGQVVDLASLPQIERERIRAMLKKTRRAKRKAEGSHARR